MYVWIPDEPLETDTAPNQEIMGSPATVGRGYSVELDSRCCPAKGENIRSILRQCTNLMLAQ